MSEKKERKITRDMTGSWNVKYRWKFDAQMLNKYLAGLKDKKIMGSKCPACKRVYAPPKQLCGKCFKEITELVEVKPVGKIVMYTAIFNTITGQPLPEPRITGMIQFEGSDSWVLGPVMNVKPDDIKVGMPIKIAWAEETKGQLSDILHFEPA